MHLYISFLLFSNASTTVLSDISASILLFLLISIFYLESISKVLANEMYVAFITGCKRIVFHFLKISKNKLLRSWKKFVLWDFLWLCSRHRQGLCDQHFSFQFKASSFKVIEDMIRINIVAKYFRIELDISSWCIHVQNRMTCLKIKPRVYRELLHIINRSMNMFMSTFTFS